LGGEVSRQILEHKDVTEKLHTSVTNFVKSLSRSCWLLAISTPTVFLNFDVVGKKYEDVHKRFTQFATKNHVATTSEVGHKCIRLVAWPCLQYEKEGFLAKGEVVVAS